MNFQVKRSAMNNWINQPEKCDKLRGEAFKQHLFDNKKKHLVTELRNVLLMNDDGGDNAG